MPVSLAAVARSIVGLGQRLSARRGAASSVSGSSRTDRRRARRRLPPRRRCRCRALPAPARAAFGGAGAASRRGGLHRDRLRRLELRLRGAGCAATFDLRRRRLALRRRRRGLRLGRSQRAPPRSGSSACDAIAQHARGLGVAVDAARASRRAPTARRRARARRAPRSASPSFSSAPRWFGYLRDDRLRGARSPCRSCRSAGRRSPRRAAGPDRPRGCSITGSSPASSSSPLATFVSSISGDETRERVVELDVASGRSLEAFGGTASRRWPRARARSRDAARGAAEIVAVEARRSRHLAESS